MRFKLRREINKHLASQNNGTKTQIKLQDFLSFTCYIWYWIYIDQPNCWFGSKYQTSWRGGLDSRIPNSKVRVNLTSDPEACLLRYTCSEWSGEDTPSPSAMIESTSGGCGVRAPRIWWGRSWAVVDPNCRIPYWASCFSRPWFVAERKVHLS